MIGEKYGRLTVIDDLGCSGKKYRKVVVKCDCGNIKIVRSDSLKSGNVKSCGCLIKEARYKRITEPTVGDRYGDLIIIKDLGTDRFRNVLCKCDCGKEKVLRFHSLLSGNTKSCGCKMRGDGNRQHGLYHHPLNRVWNEMKQRCYNLNDSGYLRYGARGVHVCEEWLNDFNHFYDWCINNGWQKGLQIDKDIKGNGLLYSPETCCFVTPKENGYHKRNNILIEYKGKTKCLAEWCEILNINRSTLIDRFEHNWSVEKAFTTATRQIKKHSVCTT